METKVNPYILELNPYTPGKPVEEIQIKYGLKKVVKLASNENPLPLPENVIQAIKEEAIHLNWYPDSDSHYLRQSLARYHNIGMENLIVGSGSVEIIRLIVRAFLKPGEKVLTSEKTFMVFKIAAIEQGGRAAILEAEMGSNHTYNLDNILNKVDDQTKIIFIANPNNPTGTMLPKREILDFINVVPQEVLIVLDNAYHEYVADPDNYLSGIDLATSRKNIIVLRTFSKIYALAGLRVGYGIADKKVITYLNRIKAPFNVTRIAQRAAIKSLENEDFREYSARLNLENRAKLYTDLEQLGLKVIPSETNFLLFFPATDINILNERLLQEGVIVRPLNAFGLADGIRVTVGSEEDNAYFIKKLSQILAADS